MMKKLPRQAFDSAFGAVKGMRRAPLWRKLIQPLKKIVVIIFGFVYFRHWCTLHRSTKSRFISFLELGGAALSDLGNPQLWLLPDDI